MTQPPTSLIAAASPAAGSFSLGKIQPISDAYSKGSDVATGAVTNTELLISNIIGLITIVGGFFFLVEFFLGAFRWISSGGDKGKVESARNAMTNGVIGMIIMVASYAAIGLIGSIIGFNILSPGAEILKLVPGAAPVPTP